MGLVVLNLDQNNLVALPESFGNLKALKKLCAKNNMLIPKSPTTGEQSIPVKFFTDTNVDTIELAGNTNITKALILKFEGIDTFLGRRTKSKEKSFQGGALTDMSLFGLD